MELCNFACTLMSSAVRRVHCMWPGSDVDSILLAVLIVSPNSVYLIGMRV
jgi:hypothetical protein